MILSGRHLSFPMVDIKGKVGLSLKILHMALTENEKQKILNLLGRQNIMRGIGFDIMNANCLSDSQKEILVRKIEKHLLNNEPLDLDKEQKSWLCRIRNEHHISNSFLYYEAEPLNWLEKILW